MIDGLALIGSIEFRSMKSSNTIWNLHPFSFDLITLEIFWYVTLVRYLLSILISELVQTICVPHLDCLNPFPIWDRILLSILRPLTNIDVYSFILTQEHRRLD